MTRVIRWSPNTTRRTIDRPVAPALDVIRHDDRVEVRMDLPGVAAEDVNVEIRDGILTISTEFTQEETNYTYRERYHGAYQRSLRLPKDVDVDNTAAAFENGVLTLSLPRVPQPEPLRIPVQG